MRLREKNMRNTHPRVVLIISLISILLSAVAMAENGKINLIFDNAQVVQENTISYFEFDVKAYISNGSDVVAEGMVYVQYPTDIFGDLIVSNQKVVVKKTGILAGKDTIIYSALYRNVNIGDTFTDVFGITFESTFVQPELKSFYSLMSSDSTNPSDLFHISMEIANKGTGRVFFPDFIPGLNLLYYDYERETFSDGLDISRAGVNIEYEQDTETDPGSDPDHGLVFAGDVEVNKFIAKYKKPNAELYWRSENESDLSGYMIERSENGGDFVELVVVPYKTAKGKFNVYDFEDISVDPENHYIYKLYANDINGIKRLLSSTELSALDKHKSILDDGTFTLKASYPNPFNPSFTVPFSVYTPQEVDIRLYDLSGKLIQTVAYGYYSSGDYEIRVSCDNLTSGVYLLRTQVNGQQAIQKMLLAK